MATTTNDNATADAHKEPAQPTRVKILIAEDNPSNYKLVEVILRNDYELIHAENGQQAIELFSKHAPQLVLMDINMPVMDGYQAMEGIHAIAPQVPVVALTAYAFDTDRIAMLKAGFVCCITKPLRMVELKNTISDILKTL
ncbi:MAG: response regulator [Alistipes sp.]